MPADYEEVIYSISVIRLYVVVLKALQKVPAEPH
jgi:hypothetical protein